MKLGAVLVLVFGVSASAFLLPPRFNQTLRTFVHSHIGIIAPLLVKTEPDNYLSIFHQYDASLEAIYRRMPKKSLKRIVELMEDVKEPSEPVEIEEASQLEKEILFAHVHFVYEFLAEHKTISEKKLKQFIEIYYTVIHGMEEEKLQELYYIFKAYVNEMEEEKVLNQKKEYYPDCKFC